MPSAAALRDAIGDSIPADGYFNDPHGRADYKRHLTYAFAEQIRLELEAPAGAAA
jgi:putative selenate reductase molybdopterin-binding subunit